MPSKHKHINESRLKTIYLRQDAPSWGMDYQPSILATPQEAPSIPHALILTPKKLGGREVHTLSTPEVNAALLGLYHPRTVGLQEQRMLSPEPRHHPLWTFPGIDRTELPPLKGIIDVAERLGYLDLLAHVSVKNEHECNGSLTVVFPWVGDLLWTVQSPSGEVFNINWTVKAGYSDFKRPSPEKKSKTDDMRSVLGRHEIEKIYYEDASIRTVQVADEGIDRNVSDNLRQLQLHHRRQLQMTEEQRQEMLFKYRSALDAGVPPVEVILQFTERGKFSVYQCRSFFYQAIWNRELRIDLFHPILINLPQRQETRDVIDVYADWFKG